ncbi:nucleotidyltransferase domain-containing protein [Xanthomonas translucens pv. translucens]|uniref:Nucleotidyltransferase domain-containing protein n=1 Tax=Xanthomonas translucens pv. translucens TaxID=134875 RepID=A0ABW9KX51_XANCT|nr:nucleotidyltransferase domain-containing protein [Xanthomonas translucens]QSQ33665.1 nucleotidyltransferase domain-containing protein [Xanthomonas translucens pv. translucens]QSQ45420.1 nucleotidyltransferase domain-containing protein [Xanthomonas translucens pv. translucens]
MHQLIRENSIEQVGQPLTAIESAERISAFLSRFREIASVRDHAWGDYFLIIYGSYAYRCATDKSDLDVLLVSDRVSTTERDAVIYEIENLHALYGMTLDNEIPYDAKVMIDISFLREAVSGGGIRSSDGWKIPKISKTKEFLTDPVNLKRFFHGMMTHPHIFVAGNRSCYETCRELAFSTLILALRQLRGLDDGASVARYMAAFCGEEGMSGDFFLGYSDSEPFASYLSENLHYRLIDRPARKVATATGRR